MEVLFEARTNIVATTGNLNQVQCRPNLHPVPVLEPDSHVDGLGTQIYGSVLRDQGLYRMWYQALPLPRDDEGNNSKLVGYAESHDGIDWRKPKLGLVDFAGLGSDHNLVDLHGHLASVFIDPQAPASHRYRSTMHTGPAKHGNSSRLLGRGYYTAHSADGLKWEYDQLTPQWPQRDVINSIYHPGQGRGIAAMKYFARIRGTKRRAIQIAELVNGQWTEAHAALVPDDFDDVSAVARGYVSDDYYGMGMLPAGLGTVGFLWQFRHRHPLRPVNNMAMHGNIDVSLVYQQDQHSCWQHMPGRPDFISHTDLAWAKGGIYTATMPVEVGQEHWLYITGSTHAHGWRLREECQTEQAHQESEPDGVLARIGLARWPKWRLFGLGTDHEATLDLKPGPMAPHRMLRLNYRCATGGSIVVEWLGLPEGVNARSSPLTGDSLGEPVVWPTGITTAGSTDVTVRLHLNKADVFAYSVD